MARNGKELGIPRNHQGELVARINNRLNLGLEDSKIRLTGLTDLGYILKELV